MKNSIRLLAAFILTIFLIGCVESDPKPTPAPDKPTPSLPTDAKQCGGIQGLACADGEYCDTGIGACNVPDGTGTCKAKTPVCTREFKPVCGCDGKQYSNACTAGAAGVSIDYVGECK